MEVTAGNSIPVLYILMRDDLDSMNPGKAMAQASHASNAFVHRRGLTESPAIDIRDNKLTQEFLNEELYLSWSTETTQGFGTVLVLGVNKTEMEQAVAVAKIANYDAEIINDPTYPLQDGDYCHFIPLDTCAYIFGNKEDPVLTAIVQNFELHE
jgi:hypothetical protein